MNLEMCSFSYALIVCSHVISIPVRYWSGARRSRERSDSARENKILDFREHFWLLVVKVVLLGAKSGTHTRISQPS